MSPRIERLLRGLVIFVLGVLGGFLVSRSVARTAKGGREPCAQCVAAGGCPGARVRPAGVKVEKADE